MKLSSCLDRDLRIADPLVAGRAHTTRHLYKSSLRPAILILIVASILYRRPGARVVLYKLPNGEARSLRDVLGKGG